MASISHCRSSSRSTWATPCAATSASRSNLASRWRHSSPIRLPSSAASLAILVPAALGVVAGVIAAPRRNSIVDIAALLGSLVGISLPIFWLGLLMMLVFSVRLQWFPAGGSGTAAHLVLPALVLGAASSGVIARMTRASMLEVLRQDYVRTARAKGIGERLLIYPHPPTNPTIPILRALRAVFGAAFGINLGRAVARATVFSPPGVGWVMGGGFFARDYPVVQGAMLVVATTFVAVNLLTDLAYAFFDPRIRYE